jgi:hypothetical protein
LILKDQSARKPKGAFAALVSRFLNTDEAVWGSDAARTA